MDRKKIESYIGLSQRANQIFYGEDIIKEKFRFVHLILIDANAPEKYRERLKNKCNEKPVFEIENLAGALHRDNIYAAAISNKGLADAIINILR